MTRLPTLQTSAALGACLGAAPAWAAGLGLSIDIPRLNVSEYHRPYVAAWIERADNSVATTLAVWYDVRVKAGNVEGEGTKWLKDLRQWWRRAGRDLDMPIDGVTSATRPAGRHQLNFTEGSRPFARLPPGDYKLVVEAAREVGGREVVTVPFQWPVTQATSQRVKGGTELGEIAVELKP